MSWLFIYFFSSLIGVSEHQRATPFCDKHFVNFDNVSKFIAEDSPLCRNNFAFWYSARIFLEKQSQVALKKNRKLFLSLKNNSLFKHN